jgi:hypothetical protein
MYCDQIWCWIIFDVDITLCNLRSNMWPRDRIFNGKDWVLSLVPTERSWPASTFITWQSKYLTNNYIRSQICSWEDAKLLNIINSSPRRRYYSYISGAVLLSLVLVYCVWCSWLVSDGSLRNVVFVVGDRRLPSPPTNNAWLKIVFMHVVFLYGD